MRMGFERPLFFLAAFIIIPGIFILARYLKPLFSLDLPLGPPGGIAFKSPVNIALLMKLLAALEIAGVFLLFTAAAGPRFVYSEIIWLSRGADIIFVMDISPSMAGMDMGGRNRYEAARILLKDFADQRPQDAMGLIAVGEDAALMIPLTTDRGSLHARLDTLELGEMGDGTALGTGLALAAFHMSRSQAPRRAVVLITDGENNAGSIHPETAAAMIGQMGVSLWVIGVGSWGEIPISYIDPVTRVRRTGIYDSRYDPDVLKGIADAAGGHWIHAPTANAFAAAFSRLDQEEMTIRRSGAVRREESLYGFFIIAAMLVLIVVRFIRRRVLGDLL